MLNELSFRNAKRQFQEYVLYFITLACTVSFMYAFNTLIFSSTVKELSSLEILPYMITAASIIIVIVMGWIISYMTNYILKKRSREISIYMLSGISNRAVSVLIYRENGLIGLLAFLIGLPIGLLLSQLLEAIVLHMFGRTYILSFQISLSATGLTFLYFSMMLWYSLRKNRKWTRKLNLCDLLYCDRQNEKGVLHGKISAISIAAVSMMFGIAGILLMHIQPLGKGIDVLIGTILLILFLFGFFLSVPAFLVVSVGGCSAWKYKKNRLVPFRGFTAKIQSISITMGILSILFMLAIAFLGIGTAVNRLANRSVELSPFDIMILHNGELIDFSSYDELLKDNFSIEESYSYSIYTDASKDFLTIRNYTIADTGREGGYAYAEFQHDTYMQQSDYIKLRELLKLDKVDLKSSFCYVHCIPALEKNFRKYIEEQGEDIKCGEYLFDKEGIFTEPFHQVEAYGNGLDYIIIVPDQVIEKMKVLYSLYVADTNMPLDSYALEKVIDNCNNLVQLDRSIGKSVSNSNVYTSLIMDKDYVSGKWIEKGSLSHLYAMSICLFYLAFVLEIIGAAILATQILSDREKKKKQDCILQQLGMGSQLIARINNRQLLMMFIIPVLPAFIVASCFVFVSVEKIQLNAYHLSIFENKYWIIQSFGGSIIFFALFYVIYYIATRIIYGKR